MKAFNITILSPDKTILKTEALSAQFPGREGYFGVLPDHAPFFAMLKEGTITVKTAEKTFKISSKEGFAAISNNKATILIDSAHSN
jgi:F-type H+-transporting ATPase subunit epsilon